MYATVYFRLLSESKLFIGLGFPYDGELVCVILAVTSCDGELISVIQALTVS